jgi:hypothetical protein
MEAKFDDLYSLAGTRIGLRDIVNRHPVEAITKSIHSVHRDMDSIFWRIRQALHQRDRSRFLGFRICFLDFLEKLLGGEGGLLKILSLFGSVDILGCLAHAFCRRCASWRRWDESHVPELRCV